MANTFARFILFLSSYIPLWAIFGVMTVRDSPWLGGLFFFLAVASLAGAVIFLRAVQNFQGVEVKVGIVQRRDSETMSYIASYVIPFAATAFDKSEQVVALCIFLLVLCVVYVNSSMIHINPLLSLMRYRLYELEDDTGNSIFLISKRNLRRGVSLRAIDLANNIFVEKR